MIELFGMSSPNVLKVAIMLEEAGLEYRTHYVRVLNGENYHPSFLALNPLAKVPVIIDHDGAGPDQPLFESGAILMYLGELYKRELFPDSGFDRWEILKWLMFQVSLVGPMLGQVNHFQLIPSETKSYAGGRYRDQAARAYRNVEERLKARPFVGGEKYSIADIAVYPWMSYLGRHGFDESDFPHLVAWRCRLDERPAVRRGVAVFNDIASTLTGGEVNASDLDKFFARSAPGPAVDLAAYAARGPMTTAKPDRAAKE